MWEPTSNAYYRAAYPLKAMELRGHQVLWPDRTGVPDLHELASCDVVHVYRRFDPETHRLLAELVRGGTAITYDNDDDFTATPAEAPNYKALGGLKGERAFGMTLKLARLARCFTTTTERLAEKYRGAGVEPVEVIGNYLAPDTSWPRERHQGVVIGWIAAGEHRADAKRLGIADVLGRLVEKHDDARVECIGVDLRLPRRYSHTLSVDFLEVPQCIGRFDIGIAPLADIPMNLTRSDIKLKEYAASGVPWLASPVGPYIGRGEAEGGRLVPDDGWFDALERLVINGRERRRLARKAKKWAKRQTIDAVADRWEEVFARAAR